MWDTLASEELERPGGVAEARRAHGSLVNQLAFFVSDLHGHLHRYQALFAAIQRERPSAVFLGGDLLPHVRQGEGQAAFVNEVLAPGFRDLRASLAEAYPEVWLILGNDDTRLAESEIKLGEAEDLWRYVQGRRGQWGSIPVFGYGSVPPTPFRLKDWERYDVSRYVDPGCISPEEGWHTVPVDELALRYGTIQKDLELLTEGEDLDGAILMLHSPPYDTKLDRAALDGRKIEGVQLDVHIGSIAIRRFIEARQPRLCLHGHVHESARITGSWQDRIGRTVLLSAAHDGRELALVRFDPERPEEATRELIDGGS